MIRSYILYRELCSRCATVGPSYVLLVPLFNQIYKDEIMFIYAYIMCFTNEKVRLPCHKKRSVNDRIRLNYGT